MGVLYQGFSVSLFLNFQELGCLTGYLFNFCTKNKDIETISKFKVSIN